MENDNYLMINGQKIEFTDEQKKQLGIVEEKKDCFDRVSYKETYYSIKHNGKVGCYTDATDVFDDGVYSVANYCTDEELMNQRALHETLNRLLWRYSMAHDGDKIDWSDRGIKKWYICDVDNKIILSYFYQQRVDGVIYFHTKGIALTAIEEIVKPFIEEHPDFVW